jgi:hypothetical protein
VAGWEAMPLTMAIFPASPAIELQRMNTAATPDAGFVADHPRNNRSGDRKIPPPVPVRPDNRPITLSGHLHHEHDQKGGRCQD